LIEYIEYISVLMRNFTLLHSARM